VNAEQLDSLRKEKLAQFAQLIATNANSGALVSGRSIPVVEYQRLQGPRAGGIKLRVDDLSLGKLFAALKRDDFAAVRSLATWNFVGDPQVNLEDRCVRIEMGWSPMLAETTVRLSGLNRRPNNSNQWVIGKNEAGGTIKAEFSDLTPHWLTAGMSGSGKSVAVRNAAIQLCAYQSNEFVLCDGKYGENLLPLGKLPGVQGPVALSVPQVRGALGWVMVQMAARYEQLAQGKRPEGRLIVVIDEFQEFCNDGTIADLLERISRQGRGALVSLLLTTQHPNTESFGKVATRRQLPGRLALKVMDFEASKIVVGKKPRADMLLSGGDCWVCRPDWPSMRAQGAYVDQKDVDEVIEHANGRVGQWQFQEWPEFDPSDVGQDLPSDNGKSKRPQFEITGAEIGISLAAAAESAGRPTFQRMMEEAGLGRPGSSRAQRLLELGREAFVWLDREGYAIATPA